MWVNRPGVGGPAAAAGSEFGANPRQFRPKGVASFAVGARQEMGAASWERPGKDQDQQHGAGGAADSMASADPLPNDAMRSWLARGIHTFGIDPRRLGGRGDARRVLGEDRRSAVPAAGAWRELASALQRHTLHNALTRLSAAERQVVTLAYLEGRTNRQIAATLGVSVSTVRRRLWLALDHLDENVRRTGTWVSSILLPGVVYVIDSLGRFTNTAAAADWPHKLAATVAVGMVGVAGVGLAAANHHYSTPERTTSPASAGLIHSMPGAPKSSLLIILPFAAGSPSTITPNAAAHVSGISPAAKATKAATDPPDGQSDQSDSTSGQSDKDDKKDPGRHRRDHADSAHAKK